MKRTPRRRARGFSTADVLVGMAVSLVGLTALYGLFDAQQKAMAATNVSTATQAAVRNVVDLMSRELRMATYDPSGLAFPVAPGPSCPGIRRGFDEGTPTKVHFRQDLNGDGAITAAGENVTYALVGYEVRRTDAAGGTVTLAAGIPQGGFVLRYFNGSNPPVEIVPGGSPPSLTASQLDCVAKVRVTVTAALTDPDRHRRKPLTSIGSSDVAIRNRELANL